MQAISRNCEQKIIITDTLLQTMECSTALSEDEILPPETTGVDLENTMLSEISGSEKAKNHVIHSYVGYETETHGHRQQYGGYQRERGWGSKG